VNQQMTSSLIAPASDLSYPSASSNYYASAKHCRMMSNMESHQRGDRNYDYAIHYFLFSYFFQTRVQEGTRLFVIWV
jgi:hypothetical protein